MKVTHKLECKINEADVENAKNALVRQTAEYEKLSLKEKDRSKTARKDLDERWKEILDLTGRAQRGVVMREVKCEELIDHDRNMRIVRRLDTGEEVAELCKPYDVAKEEPLTAEARKRAKAGAAATSPTNTAPTRKGAADDVPKFSTETGGLVEVLDIEGKVRKVKPEIAERIVRANREGLPVLHGFGPKEPNVELAMVVGVPVYAVDEDGKTWALTAPQVKLVRDGYRAYAGGVAIAVAGELIDVVGFKGVGPMPSKAPEQGAKKGAKKSAAAKPAQKKQARGRKGAEARA